MSGQKKNPQTSQNTAVLGTKTFPITLYRVSKEWIANMYLEMKRTVMAQAIATDCPKEFLEHLNGLELHFNDSAQISLKFHKKTEEGEEVSETIINEEVFKQNVASQATQAPEEPEQTEEPAAEAAEEAAASEA